ncbi:MAG: hypothetical protein ACR2K0_10220 [Acidimicrobiales bacterium]
MLRTLLRTTVKLGTVGAIVAGVSKVLQRRRLEPGPAAGPGTWPRLDLPEEQSPLDTTPPTAEEVAAAEREAAADLERRMHATAAEVATRVSTEAPDGPGSNGSEAPTTWVEPDDATCPASHPVKAKLASMVFHLPGMAHYDRTKPDRCYPDATTAEADGLRQSKR